MAVRTMCWCMWGVCVSVYVQILAHTLEFIYGILMPYNRGGYNASVYAKVKGR